MIEWIESEEDGPILQIATIGGAMGEQVGSVFRNTEIGFRARYRGTVSQTFFELQKAKQWVEKNYEEYER